jgi:hypothetical protein
MTRPVVFLGLIGSLLCSSCTSEDGVEKHTPEAVEKFEIREQKMTVAHLKDGAIIYGTLVEDGTGFLVLNTAKTGKVRIDK